jgi:hypothetical protein
MENMAKATEECPCAGAYWQKYCGNLQAKCSVCLLVDRFFDQPAEDQRREMRQFMNYQALFSSWLATSDLSAAAVSIPVDIAKKAAGWIRPARGTLPV